MSMPRLQKDRWSQCLILGSLVGLALLAADAPTQTVTGPSALCHVTDGTFTACADGSEEWSDITPAFFAESGAYLYADQADLDPQLQSVHPVTGQVSDLDTFVLMYDECQRTTPLGPDEFFLISFDTVEVEAGIEKLERYTLHIFADGTIIFIEDGVLETDDSGEFRVEEIDGQRGDVGFGSSPNCPFDHVIAEFQIVLETAGGNSYSPDPSFWTATPPEPPDCESGEIRLPVLVNVLPGVSITNDQIAEAVSGGNGILDQAGTCGALGSDSIIRDASDQGNNDNSIDIGEDRALDRACVQELNSTFGGGRGVKLIFANRIHNDFGNRGATTHDPATPCIYVRASRTAEGGVHIADTGTTIAHEMGHVFTIGDHVDDPSNLMSDGGTGLQLTPEQIEDIRADAIKRSLNTEHAGWTDDIGDVSQAFIDLYIGSLFAADLNSDLEVAVNLGGLHPGGAVNTRFQLFFDTDNDLATGGAFGAFSGIDKVLEISLAGQFPFEAPGGSLSASLLDVATSTATALAPGIVERIQKIVDNEVAPSSFTDHYDSVHQSVPLSALELTAQQVPIGVRATNLDTAEFDETAFVFNLSVGVGFGAMRAGFDANTLAPNDDGSTNVVPIGFNASFFGNIFTDLFVNNNGNVTFDAPLSTFTPFDLTSTGRVIVAPFFADVDTSNSGDPVRYGPGTVNGRPAFGVSWRNVDCFDSDPARLARNFFQVILIDRSDVAPGDFDIEFNYDQIQWETGEASGGSPQCLGGASARVGFSNGTGAPGTSFELPGSGIPGAFLDSNLQTGLIHGSLNSGQLGRYVFPVRSGTPETERDGDLDGVPDELDNCPATANPDQADSDLNGTGDLCQTPDSQHSTAAFLEARLNGSATFEATGLTVADEPGIFDRVLRIVEFRVREGLTNSAAQLTENLINSLVASGLVAPEDRDQLITDILEQLDQEEPVAIDIKPGSFPNSINLSARGRVPVAILGSATFDATRVDRSSVVFAGAPALSIGGEPEDVNGDGLADVVLHFRIRSLQLGSSDTEACLTGQLMSGESLSACDSVRIVGR